MDKRTASALGSLAGVLVLALVWWAVGSGGGDDGASGSARPSTSTSAGQEILTPGPTGLPLERESLLPVQARQTLALIDRGGPYPYPDHDGGVFGNYEGLLPDEPRGYYREYTVKDPAESDRGPWRIITGSSGEFFWTPDHYAHFFEIDRS